MYGLTISANSDDLELSDLQGHSAFSNGIFSYSCAAVDKISTNIASRGPSAAIAA